MIMTGTIGTVTTEAVTGTTAAGTVTRRTAQTVTAAMIGATEIRIGGMETESRSPRMARMH